MSLVDFYREKADRCTRMAAAATDPAKRMSLREEGHLWRGIALDELWRRLGDEVDQAA